MLLGEFPVYCLSVPREEYFCHTHLQKGSGLRLVALQQDCLQVKSF